ncbi:MAG: SPOR domain-containing protein [Treponema sp.]|nr:SPOR domain-containing protein [Treponema sp.]
MMKKQAVTALAAAALLLLQGASVWEGAAAVAPNGELPEGGYYAATNSFPRNTVVDITNLETGKTVRVIVAVGLDSPGLLAVVSRDAAEAVGLQSRSIGRIRMTQPSDPIAFSRFIEGLGSSGDPDYDPRARIAETLNGPSAAGTGEDFVDLPEASRQAVTEDPRDPWAVSPGAAGEQGGIADLPETVPPPLVYPPGTGDSPAALPGVLPEPDIAEQPYIPPDVEAAPRYQPETAPPPPIAGGSVPDTVPGAAVPEEALSWDAGAVPDAASGAAVPEEALPWDAGAYDLTLVPAEERPPESAGRTIPEDRIVPGIPPAAEELQLVTEPFIDPRYVIDPVPALAAAPEGPPAETVPGPAYSIFSVPVISRLEQGKYYLQLGAFSRAEAVESELNRIGRTYPLAVQSGGSPESPVYRILLGPVNPGESGALLRRFKGSGYRDAFIRQDG